MKYIISVFRVLSLLYASETWAVKKEHESKLERTKMQMVMWMCGVSLKDGRSNEELRRRLGIESVLVELRRRHLRWFGHVERKPKEDWVKRCRNMEVEGMRKAGRPRKTWGEVVKEDLRAWGELSWRRIGSVGGRH